jgi:lambda family phage portal protein
MKFFAKIKNLFSNSEPLDYPETFRINRTTGEKTPMSDLTYAQDIFTDIHDGSPFPGSFGGTKSFIWVDYWTLRKRSMELFEENPYAKGIMRRLVRNEINTGLSLEAAPIEKILGMTEDQAMEWGNDRETDWKIWTENPQICDWQKKRTFAELEEERRMTALISGDVLTVLRINPKTGLPAVDLIDGQYIQTPPGEKVRAGNKILHGIEIDKNKRHVAYWVQTTENGYIGTKYKRIPAWGEKSGRRLAWLSIGSKGLLDEIRGEPLLACMLYMMKELDRYRNSEERAALVNSLLPLFIKKTADTISTRPFSAGATRKAEVDVTQSDGSSKKWNIASMLPGTVIQDLAKGEEPVSFNTQRPNVNYVVFEDAILNVFAWVSEVPPETLKLQYKQNFSASRQANNEFNVYLKYRNWKNGKEFNQIVYQELTVQQTLIGDIQAPGLLEAWRDPKKWKEFGAWINAEWTGISRPSVDYFKDVQAAAKIIDYGLGTQDQQCRKLSDLPFKVVLRQRKQEIEAAKKAGVSFASEENQNREPISAPGTAPAEEQNVNVNNIMKVMNELSIAVEELNDKFNDYEVEVLQ